MLKDLIWSPNHSKPTKNANKKVSVQEFKIGDKNSKLFFSISKTAAQRIIDSHSQLRCAVHLDGEQLEEN
jgi:hypothetical protein